MRFAIVVAFVVGTLVAVVASPGFASDEDPECRGRCASDYQACTRTCKPAPGEPFDARKVNGCGDRCIKEARSCNQRCARR